MQTFEAKVANVCGNGCNALRLRRVKLAPGSSVLYWIREKRMRDTPLTSHCSPHLMYLVIPDSTSSKEKSIKTVIRRYWRDFKTETSLT